MKKYDKKNKGIPSGPAGERNIQKPKLTILVVVLTAFVTTFTGSALNLSIPDLGRQFGVSAGTVGWLVTGYTLAVAAVSVPAGRIADLTRRKTVLTAGILFFTACCIGAVFSMSMLMLIVIRVVQGIGAAMIFSTNTAILLSVFPAESRGRVIGYSLAATYAGLSSGPVLGGFLNQQLGWESVFLFTGAISAAAFFAALRLPGEVPHSKAEGKLPEPKAEMNRLKREAEMRTSGCKTGSEPPDSKVAVKSLELKSETSRLRHLAEVRPPECNAGSESPDSKAEKKTAVSRLQHLDLRGNLLYLVSIVSLMYGLSEIGKGWMPMLWISVGLIFGVFFLRRELRAEEPAVDVRLFHQNIGYGFSNLSALLNYGATFAISYLVSIYLQVVQGFSSQATGLIMIAQPAIMAGLSPVAGKLSDRISPFKLSSAGMALCAAGTGLFIFLNQGSSLWIVIAALVITGLGFALFSSPNTNAVMSCVEENDYGVASSILATMRSIGHTLSMVVVTVIVTIYMQDASLAEASPETLIQVNRVAFIIFTGICTIGVFVSLKRR